MPTKPNCKTQVERARDRGITEDEAKNIINNQMPLEEKIKTADFIIDNSKSFFNLKERCIDIFNQIEMEYGFAKI